MLDVGVQGEDEARKAGLEVPETVWSKRTCAADVRQRLRETSSSVEEAM